MALDIFPDMIWGSPFHSTNNNERQQARLNGDALTTHTAGASKGQAGHERMTIA